MAPPAKPVKPADRQAAVKKLEAFMKTLRDKVAYTGAAEKRLAELRSRIEASRKASLADIDRAEHKIKVEGDVADITAMFAGGVKSCLDVRDACKGMRALEAIEVKTPEITKEIDALDKSVRVTIRDGVVHPLASPAYAAGATVLSEGAKSDNSFLHAVGVAADWFGALTSPSGWAEFITHAHRDLAKVRAAVDKQHKDTLDAIDAREARLRKEEKAAQDMLKVLAPALQNMKKG